VPDARGGVYKGHNEAHVGRQPGQAQRPAHRRCAGTHDVGAHGEELTKERFDVAGMVRSIVGKPQLLFPMRPLDGLDDREDCLRPDRVVVEPDDDPAENRVDLRCGDAVGIGQRSLDVARKQAVMEGFKLLSRTLELASEVRKLVNSGYNTAKQLLSENKDTLEKIAQALIEREVLDANEIRILVDGKELPPIKLPSKDEAGVQQVQTTESSISDLVDRRVWQQMPLETRDQNNFINLLAGAAQGNIALSNLNGGTDRGAAVNGTRSGTAPVGRVPLAAAVRGGPFPSVTSMAA